MLVGNYRFISDIASFELKPLFLVGSSITAVCFVITVAAVHVMRYEPGFALLKAANPRFHRRGSDLNRDHLIDNSYGTANTNANTETNNASDTNNPSSDNEDDQDSNITKTLRFISLLSILAASLASTALIMLSVMDTFRHHLVHHFFLQLCFCGLALQAAGTAVVYANEVIGFISFLCNRGRWLHDWGERCIKVRILYSPPFLARLYACGVLGCANVTSASLSTALILIEVFLCISFLSITQSGRVNVYRRAAILEWIIAFLGTVYLWLFGGFFLDRYIDSSFTFILKTATDNCRTDPRHLPGRLQGDDPEPDPERRPLLGNTDQGRYTGEA